MKMTRFAERGSQNDRSHQHLLPQSVLREVPHRPQPDMWGVAQPDVLLQGLQVKHANQPTVEDLAYLRVAFYYDEQLGALCSRATGAPIKKNNGRYYQVRYGNPERNVVAHRVVWFLTRGVWPEGLVDHSDGNGLNNRKDNLRLGTQSQNMENTRGAKRNNKLGLLGVHSHKNLFRATIVICGARRDLGLFKTPEAAHITYLAKKREHHGFNTL